MVKTLPCIDLLVAERDDGNSRFFISLFLLHTPAERYVDECVVNGGRSSVLGEERGVHVDSAVFKTGNYMRRHEIAEGSNHAQIVLLGRDRFRRYPLFERVLSTVHHSNNEILHLRQLSERNIVLLAETADWRFNYLVSALASFIGGADNLLGYFNDSTSNTSNLLMSPSSRR